ncbi:MAG: hypothetical protein ACRD1C_01290 [Terriglobales bacterium]
MPAPPALVAPPGAAALAGAWATVITAATGTGALALGWEVASAWAGFFSVLDPGWEPEPGCGGAPDAAGAVAAELAFAAVGWERPCGLACACCACRKCSENPAAAPRGEETGDAEAGAAGAADTGTGITGSN